jgi:hypothetical protein
MNKNAKNTNTHPSEKDKIFLSFDETEENIVKTYVLPLTLMVLWLTFVTVGTWMVCY